MRFHPDRLDVVLLGGLEVGVTEQIRGDADLLGRAVDQLGDGAVAEQVGPDRLLRMGRQLRSSRVVA
jgi:hypothetical protein